MEQRLRVLLILIPTATLVLVTLFLENPSRAPAQAQQPSPTPLARLTLPPNQPARGLVYDGLEPDIDGTCPRLFHVKNTRLCSHGPDPAPIGSDVKKSVAPLSLSTPSASAIQCDGDGVSGKRVQVLYAHASNVTDRFATYLASFRQWAADADAMYQFSAAETYGYRRIRFVHDSNCIVSVIDATMVITGDDSFDNTIGELQRLGYNRSDRKYMVFVDANVYCGIGNLYGDDSPGVSNWNNSGPLYGRADNGCWNGAVVAHELMHNLGGVQLSAPHSSGGWHCVDEYDRMCYSDYPNYPTMQYLCPTSAHDNRFDCNHDDYFGTNPAPGSYLATHWNTANNVFLITGGLPSRILIPMLLKGK